MTETVADKTFLFAPDQALVINSQKDFTVTSIRLLLNLSSMIKNVSSLTCFRKISALKRKPEKSLWVLKPG
jgi:hypothetical protein